MPTPIKFAFDEVRATQVAAELIELNEGHFDHYVLCKCLYLIDREALRRWGQPVIGGDYRLYLHGPVITQALSAMKLGRRGFYSDHIERSANDVSVLEDPGRDELSRAELDLVREVFGDWGGLNFKTARERIHSLPECDDPTVLNIIPIEVLLRHLGKSEEAIASLAKDVEALNRLDSLSES